MDNSFQETLNQKEKEDGETIKVQILKLLYHKTSLYSIKIIKNKVILYK